MLSLFYSKASFSCHSSKMSLEKQAYALQSPTRCSFMMIWQSDMDFWDIPTASPFLPTFKEVDHSFVKLYSRSHNMSSLSLFSFRFLASWLDNF